MKNFGPRLLSVAVASANMEKRDRERLNVRINQAIVSLTGCDVLRCSEDTVLLHLEDAVILRLEEITSLANFSGVSPVGRFGSMSVT